MLVDKFALSAIRMYDKIESLTSALTDLRRFVETHVSERDYVGLGYKCRDKFIDDVVDAVVYLHLRNEKFKSKICCADDGETLNYHHHQHTSRRLVNINQYRCKNCGTINNFCTTLRNFNEKEEEKFKDDDENSIDDDDNDDDSLDEDDVIDDDDDIKSRSQVRRNAILFISKWTIFKLVTELFLWARCWFWGYCEKPWYILWNRKNKILNTVK
ncbi:hypothetical protein [Spodoptera cosmioides nucleopolyhedrovirus]|uniref:Uncharacterized protein n=1 Tax=Spodoptera cosmioides nucleopolyhedrovirus TaxID=2605774 RepID=A0A6B7KTA3_9ABAC|nr:hypothetical protein [Spodoptera cosmioides nucleopolyhedrovirus]